MNASELEILQMLVYKRPAGSNTEKDFLERFIMPLGPVRRAQNLVVEVPGGSGKTLFSCHTDTVHWQEGKQEIIHDANLNLVYKKDNQALGADDTAGVWLLRQMILKKIPGVYVFHYGEEKGCIGSRDMAKKFPKWLKGFERAIAFDRRGDGSIITHQMGNRTCSDKFGTGIADQLTGFALDTTGSYTDTASYSGIIRECTNLSIGYAREHSGDEHLDLDHLFWMAEHVPLVEWDKLPTERSVDGTSARDSGRKYYQGYGGGNRQYGYTGWQQGKVWDQETQTYLWPSEIETRERNKRDASAPKDPIRAEAAKAVAQTAAEEILSFARALEICNTEGAYAATLLLVLMSYYLQDEDLLKEIPDKYIQPFEDRHIDAADQISDCWAGIADDAIKAMAKKAARKAMKRFLGVPDKAFV